LPANRSRWRSCLRRAAHSGTAGRWLHPRRVGGTLTPERTDAAKRPAAGGTALSGRRDVFAVGGQPVLILGTSAPTSRRRRSNRAPPMAPPPGRSAIPIEAPDIGPPSAESAALVWLTCATSAPPVALAAALLFAGGAWRRTAGSDGAALRPRCGGATAAVVAEGDMLAARAAGSGAPAP
jgi:hypothetical protein